MTLLIPTPIEDKRIHAKNYIFEISIMEYENIARQILATNEFQRKRVHKQDTVYTLMKNDLVIGCILPPLVLAIRDNTLDTLDLASLLVNATDNKLIILDGLQRTYTILELIDELKAQGEDQKLQELYKRPIRIELYAGMNKIGILYRMLTLNAGQTPMSLRHQIEILYSDYLKIPVDNITLLTEVDDTANLAPGTYQFKDIIEGFNSYLEREEVPIDKKTLLDNIKGLEKLSKENLDQDLFVNFVKTYDNLIHKLVNNSDSWVLTDEVKEPLSSTAFGKNVYQIFTKPQCISGFGAAIGKAFDNGIIKGTEELNTIVSSISATYNKNEIDELIHILDDIRSKASKIGIAQRVFFHFFFKDFLDKQDTDCYLKLLPSATSAHKRFAYKFNIPLDDE